MIKRTKTSIIILAACAAAAFGVGSYLFLVNSSPYRTIKEAKLTSAKVNIQGIIQRETVKKDPVNNRLQFIIKDSEGDSMDVVYTGAIPSNFDQAPQAVVSGSYNNGVFHAVEILTKCPSKYQSEKKAEP